MLSKVSKRHLMRGLLLFFFAAGLSLMTVSAQAPDCDMCDMFLEPPNEDPVAYAICVEQNCGTAIPIDDEIWLLVISAFGLGVYYTYQLQDKTVKKAAEQKVS